jgi:hypothetical protein
MLKLKNSEPYLLEDDKKIKRKLELRGKKCRQVIEVIRPNHRHKTNRTNYNTFMRFKLHQGKMTSYARNFSQKQIKPLNKL